MLKFLGSPELLFQRGTGVLKIGKKNRNEIANFLNLFAAADKTFLLTVPRRGFLYGPFMLFLSCFCYDFVRACLLLPCGHLLGKG